MAFSRGTSKLLPPCQPLCCEVSAQILSRKGEDKTPMRDRARAGVSLRGKMEMLTFSAS